MDPSRNENRQPPPGDRQQNSSSQSKPLPTQGGLQGKVPSQAQKKPSEMSALDRLKHIQSNFKQHWKGINCEFAGRPGTSNFVNRKRMYTVSECAI